MVETYGTGRIPDEQDHRAGARALQADAPGHHGGARPAAAHLPQDGRVRPLRPARPRIHLGEDRPRVGSPFRRGDLARPHDPNQGARRGGGDRDRRPPRRRPARPAQDADAAAARLAACRHGCPRRLPRPHPAIRRHRDRRRGGGSRGPGGTAVRRLHRPRRRHAHARPASLRVGRALPGRGRDQHHRGPLRRDRPPGQPVPARRRAPRRRRGRGPPRRVRRRRPSRLAASRGLAWSAWDARVRRHRVAERRQRVARRAGVAAARAPSRPTRSGPPRPSPGCSTAPNRSGAGIRCRPCAAWSRSPGRTRTRGSGPPADPIRYQGRTLLRLPSVRGHLPLVLAPPHPGAAALGPARRRWVGGGGSDSSRARSHRDRREGRAGGVRVHRARGRRDGGAGRLDFHTGARRHPGAQQRAPCIPRSSCAATAARSPASSASRSSTRPTSRAVTARRFGCPGAAAGAACRGLSSNAIVLGPSPASLAARRAGARRDRAGRGAGGVEERAGPAVGRRGEGRRRRRVPSVPARQGRARRPVQRHGGARGDPAGRGCHRVRRDGPPADARVAAAPSPGRPRRRAMAALRLRRTGRPPGGRSPRRHEAGGPHADAGRAARGRHQPAVRRGHGEHGTRERRVR